MSKSSNTLLNAMSKLMEEGWTLTGMTCPVSKTPLLRGKDKQLYCPECNAPIVTEAEFQNGSGSPIDLCDISTKLISAKTIGDARKAAETKSELEVRVEPDAPTTIVDDRPPPQLRGTSKTSVASNKLSEKLLAGWQMNRESCNKCGTPTMTPRGESEAVCVVCVAPAPPTQSSTAAAATTTTANTTAAASKKKVSSDEASKKIGPKLLQGWKMLAASCQDCNCPLMSAKGSTRQYCVVCERYTDDNNAKPSSNTTGGTAESKIDAPAKAAAVEDYNYFEEDDEHDYVDDPQAWKARVKAIAAETIAADTVVATAKHSAGSHDWSAALREVQGGIAVDEQAGPRARAVGAIPLNPAPYSSPTTHSTNSATAAKAAGDATKRSPATVVKISPVLNIQEPSAEEIARLARGLEAADRDDSTSNSTTIPQPVRQHTPPTLHSVLPASQPATARPSAVSDKLHSSSAGALSVLREAVHATNLKIQALGPRLAAEPHLVGTIAALAADLPKLVEAMNALERVVGEK